MWIGVGITAGLLLWFVVGVVIGRILGAVLRRRRYEQTLVWDGQRWVPASRERPEV